MPVADTTSVVYKWANYTHAVV